MPHLRWGTRSLLASFVLFFLLVPTTMFAMQEDANPPLSQTVQQQNDCHKVVWGDTLFRLARRYNTTVHELVRLNNIANPNLIYVGQCLQVNSGPPPATSTPVPPGQQTIHTVRPGDTVYGLAYHYGVTPQSIIEANHLANPNLIYIGDKLIIPGVPSGPTSTPAPATPTAAPVDPTATPAPDDPTATPAPVDPTATPAPDDPTATPAPDDPTATPAPDNPTPTPEPEPSPISDMFWGSQAHMLNQDMARIVGASEGMNLQWLKQQIRWSDFEPNPGEILWGPIDNLVNGAGSQNLLFSVLAAPDWARGAGTDPNVVGPPGDPATYANFVGQLAGRYCGRVQAIEVWNEQNLQREWGGEDLNAARYMDLLKAAYPAIKTACPGTTVVSGALTPTGAPPPVAIDDFIYLNDMYVNGLLHYSDAIGIHPSGFNIPPSLTYDQACEYIQETGSTFMGPCDTPHHSWTFYSTLIGTREIMVANGDSDKTIWVTEFGWAVGSGSVPPGYEYAQDNTREEQAAWTSQAFSMGRNSGYVGAMFLWNLNFADVAPGSEQSLWSVYDTGYTPTITVPAVHDTPH